MKNTLKIQRAIREITQEELAAAMGVSRKTINSIETNRYVPSVLLCLRIAKYFQKPMEEVFILEEGDE